MSADTITLHFAPDHPAGEGHFPGNPIIPGGLLLAAAVREIASSLGREFNGVSIKSAKFLHPVRPGESVSISYEVSERNEIRFHGTVAEARVLSGVMNAAAGG